VGDDSLVDVSYVLSNNTEYNARVGLALRGYSAYLPDISITGGATGTAKLSMVFRTMRHRGLRAFSGSAAAVTPECRANICGSQALIVDAVYAQPRIRLEVTNARHADGTVAWGFVGGTASVNYTDSTTLEISSDANILILHRILSDAATSLGVLCDGGVDIDLRETLSVPMLMPATRPEPLPDGTTLLRRTARYPSAATLEVTTAGPLQFTGTLSSQALTNLRLEGNESLRIKLQVRAVAQASFSDWADCEASYETNTQFTGSCTRNLKFSAVSNNGLTLEARPVQFVIGNARTVSLPARSQPISFNLTSVRGKLFANPAPAARVAPPQK
jgi:hypothetical protein